MKPGIIMERRKKRELEGERQRQFIREEKKDNWR